jgi:hypothetical protein
VYVGPDTAESISRNTQTQRQGLSGDDEVNEAFSGDDEEGEWCIESFQIGETGTFIRHVRKGVELFVQNSDAGSGGDGSVLVFSGGAVKGGLLHQGRKMGVGELVGKREVRSEGAG